MLKHSKIELKTKKGDVFSSQFKLSKKVPKDIVTTAAFTFPIKNNLFLLILDKKGFWNPPGGHIKKGEVLEECIKRETLEEGGVSIDELTLFGYLEIEILVRKSLPYPTKTIMPITYSKVTKINSNWKPGEAQERKFLTRAEALSILEDRDDSKQMYLIFSELKNF